MADYLISRRTLIKAGAASLAGIAMPIARSATKAPIRLGGTYNLTGTLAFDGLWNSRAVAAAVKRINAGGGVGGRPIELLNEDCQTNVMTCSSKFRSLVLKSDADFVIGAIHSGINIATAPIAKQNRIPYFAMGTAVDITGKDGNRWIFRPINNIRQQMMAIAETAGKQLKHRYVFAAWDYAWGHSFVSETKHYLEPYKPKFIADLYMPVGTQDFGTYVSKLDPKSFDVLAIGMAGGDAVRFIRQAYDLGLSKGKVILGNIEAIAEDKISDIGPAAEGAWITTMYPRDAASIRSELKDYDASFREGLGVDGDGNDRKTGRPAQLAYASGSWQAVFMLKRAIEQSGWRNRQDNEKLLPALEGMQCKASIEFPQGDCYIRAEDHQVFQDQYISEVKGGKLVVRDRVPKEKLVYPVERNLQG